jgi:hypothetical protein
MRLLTAKIVAHKRGNGFYLLRFFTPILYTVTCVCVCILFHAVTPLAKVWTCSLGLPPCPERRITAHKRVVEQTRAGAVRVAPVGSLE